MKKLFGGLRLTWPKLIIFAVIAGIYTGIMAMIPAARDTSFADISISFEWWVLFGILIIVNSKSPLDSALKCIVFFLISQPLVYLVQVPFNPDGWGIFRYYPGWFVWTLFTFPMGFVGWFMKKNKWYSLLILTPMLVFVGGHYSGFFRESFSFFPNHLLSAVFCVATMIIYPLFIFDSKKLKMIGLGISIAVIIAASAVALVQGRNVYSTILKTSSPDGIDFNDSYSVSLEDESIGKVWIEYDESLECYTLHAEFKSSGETKISMKSPDGKDDHVFDITVGRNTYDINEVTDNSEEAQSAQ